MRLTCSIRPLDDDDDDDYSKDGDTTNGEKMDDSNREGGDDDVVILTALQRQEISEQKRAKLREIEVSLSGYLYNLIFLP